MLDYPIINNKIHTTEGCELNVVYHCNLSCRACSHLSPTFKKEFVDPDKVFNDFHTLAKFYHPEYVKLLGGEPLLHPKLIDVIKAIRQSKISEHIQVCTNGKLLLKMSDIFWQEIDEINISVYPGQELTKKKISEIKNKAKKYHVEVKLFYFDNFRESYSELGTTNTELIRRIYSTCKIAHIWRCHTVVDGYFYKCPLSLLIPKVISPKTFRIDYQDGIKITDSPEFTQELLAYLQSSEPLSSCSHCLGSAGKLRQHEQIERNKWRLQQKYSTEEMIDWNYLTTLEKLPNADDSCVRWKQQKILITNLVEFLSKIKKMLY